MSIHVGTAGWSLRREHQVLFGEGASHLARYATRLNAVEINSSFYRPHRRTTYQRWAAAVPSGFRFAVKMPRVLTHTARLKDMAPLEPFLEQVRGLGTKLGPLLVQLPPSLGFEAPVAAGFFAALRQRHDGPVAFEPRHASWFEPRAETLLRKFRVARVAADPAPVAAGAEPGGWREWRYWRWHGSPKIYYSEYAEAALAMLGTRLRDADWCIFDNTALGAALPNALDLRGRL